MTRTHRSPAPHSSEKNSGKKNVMPSKKAKSGKKFSAFLGDPAEDYARSISRVSSAESFYELIDADEEKFNRNLHRSAEEVRRFKLEARDLSHSFLATFDRKSCIEALTAKNAPDLHHHFARELIKSALLDVLQHKVGIEYGIKEEDEGITSTQTTACDEVAELLAHMDNIEILTSRQLASTVIGLYRELPDLMLDAPDADEYLNHIAHRLIDSHMLSREATHSLEVASTPAQLRRLKRVFRDIVTEFLATGNIEETRRALLEVDEPLWHFEFVKTLVNVSMDGNPAQREHVSRLLAACTSQTGESEFAPLSQEQVEKGFLLLLQRAEDLVLDMPKVVEYLSKFVARAVDDEALIPKFLDTSRAFFVEGDLGLKILKHAQTLLDLPHSRAALSACWGVVATDGRTVRHMRNELRQLAREFFECTDLSAAVEGFNSILHDRPHLGHEVVVQAFRAACDVGRKRESMLAGLLLQKLIEEDMLTSRQWTIGRQRVESGLGDTVVDFPHARVHWDHIVGQVKSVNPANHIFGEHGTVTQEYVHKLDSTIQLNQSATT
ncbi:MAG: hypothetical protein MHM6MM_001277 [Cercozoa sp. M6MM]